MTLTPVVHPNAECHMVSFPRSYFARLPWQLFHYRWASPTQLRGVGIALNNWRFQGRTTSQSVVCWKLGPFHYVTVDLTAGLGGAK